MTAPYTLTVQPGSTVTAKCVWCLWHQSARLDGNGVDTVVAAADLHAVVHDRR